MRGDDKSTEQVLQLVRSAQGTVQCFFLPLRQILSAFFSCFFLYFIFLSWQTKIEIFVFSSDSQLSKNVCVGGIVDPFVQGALLVFDDGFVTLPCFF